MATVISRQNCNKSLANNLLVLNVVIESDVTELHPEMFVNCRNLQSIVNNSFTGLITTEMLKGTNKVTIEEKGKPRTNPDLDDLASVPKGPEPEKPKPKPVVEKKVEPLADKPKYKPAPAPAITAKPDMDTLTLNRIYYSIHPSIRAKYGATKEEVVAGFLAVNYRRRMS